MKIPVKLVTFVFLLGIIKVISFNPDSEIVQDPSEDSTGAGTANARQVRSSEEVPRIAVIADSYAGFKVLRPYTTNIGIIWREIGSAYGNERIRVRNRYMDVSRVTSSNGFVVPSGNRDVRPGSIDVDSPSISMSPSNTDKDSNDGRTGIKGGGTRDNPSSDDGSTLSGGLPSGQGNRNYGYGVRNPSSFRPNAGDQTPISNGNAPSDRDFGRNAANPPGVNREPPVPSNPQGSSSDNSPSTTNDKRVSPDANLFAGIVNDFAFKLMERLNLNSNFVISPLSIFVALSMCYLGADGRTKAQLEQVLGLNDYAVHGVHLHQGISDLVSMVSPESDEYQLFFANGLFPGKNFTVEESFKEDIQKYYGAQLKNLDFGNQAISMREINEWVAKNTGNTIESLLTSPLPVFTKLVILNAIFFKGIWKTQFPRELTRNSKFFTLDGNEREVPFMNVFRETFPFLRSDEHGHYFIKLPYKGDQVSMIIALPYSHEEAPMPSVTDLILCHVRDALVNTQLGTVSIPKFRFEYTTSLKEPLKDLGIKDIFDSSVNLSKMRKWNDVFVDDILHKALVDVNEEGTTASATTGVKMVPYTSLRTDFDASHPFAFYIVHEASGLVLFYGKIYDIGESTQALPNNGRENVRASEGNTGSNPRSPQDNRRENIRVPPSNVRNNPQVPPRWERPQIPQSYRRESPHVLPNNRA